VVKGPAAFHGVAFDIRVAAQPQQQRDERQPLHEHRDGLAQHEFQPGVGGAGGRTWLLQNGLEAAKGVVQGELEKVALGRHVVVDRRFRDAQVFRENAHGCGVVAVAVEDVDGDEEHRLLVVSGTAALRGC
jgi:hypothetical protein